MKLLRNTKTHSKYWEERKIDWNQSYLSTWNHPHRDMIADILGRMKWHSLFEIGCGPGPNLVNIIKRYPNKMVGGVDVNADAIKLANETFGGGIFKVGSLDDIMMSDKSTDVILSDMALIYISDINKAIKEIKRIGRHYVVLCELHSENWFKRLWLKLRSGYHAYNYKTLLKKHDFEDITTIKIPPEVWDGKPQRPFGYIILARIPRR